MNIIDIENLSFAELKERRAELLAEIAIGDPQLPARYLQARMDSKMRDEKLAEQAVTLKALQDGMGAAVQRAEDLAAKLGDSEGRERQLSEWLHRAKEQGASDQAMFRQKVDELTAAGKAEIDRLLGLLDDQAALNGAAKLLNDAIAAQQIETADKGQEN